jgi:hypothetical protein
MVDQFWDLQQEEKRLEEYLEFFTTIYKIDTDIELESQLRNIRQDESESMVPFQVWWMKLMRQLAAHKLRPLFKLSSAESRHNPLMVAD